MNYSCKAIEMTNAFLSVAEHSLMFQISVTFGLTLQEPMFYAQKALEGCQQINR